MLYTLGGMKVLLLIAIAAMAVLLAVTAIVPAWQPEERMGAMRKRGWGYDSEKTTVRWDK